MNPEDDNLTQSAEVFYLSNDKNRTEFDNFYSEMNDQASWCALNWNDPRLLKVKEKYSLDCVPRVIVLDRNLEIITEEGADDLLKLGPTACREVWCQIQAHRVQKLREDD